MKLTLQQETNFENTINNAMQVKSKARGQQAAGGEGAGGQDGSPGPQAQGVNTPGNAVYRRMSGLLSRQAGVLFFPLTQSSADRVGLGRKGLRQRSLGTVLVPDGSDSSRAQGTLWI